jgi:SPP1 gp7 family putative phage head morphogenesis protein
MATISTEKIKESAKQSPNAIIENSNAILNNKKEKGFIVPQWMNSYDFVPKMNVEEEMRRGERSAFTLRKRTRPSWFYNTPYGVPRGINPHTLRVLASTWVVQSCISVYQADIRSMKYEIVAQDPKMSKDPTVIETINDYKDMLLSINDDGETVQDIWEKWIKDILEVDAGVFVFHYDMDAYTWLVGDPDKASIDGTEEARTQRFVPESVEKGKLAEVTAEDGALFYKDYYKDGKLMGYWQHFYTGGGVPKFYGKQEISYSMFNPSTYTPYGWSKVQQLYDVLVAMIASVLNTADFASKGALPPGIIELRGADEDEAKAFRDYWRKKVQGSPSKFAIIGSPEDGQINFIPLNFSSDDITFLNGLDFFWRVVMATFMVSPNELGITDTVNKSTSESQERVNKRTQKIPMFTKLERFMNIDLIPIMHKNSHLVKFVWQVDEDIDKIQKQETITTSQIERGGLTMNEDRAVRGLDPYDDPRADIPKPFWEMMPSENDDFGFDIESELASLASELKIVDDLKNLKKKNITKNDEITDQEMSNNIDNFTETAEKTIKLSIFGTMKLWFNKIKEMIKSFMINNPNATVSEGMLDAVSRMTQPGNTETIGIRKTLEENLTVLFREAWNMNDDFTAGSSIFNVVPNQALQFLKANALLVSDKLTTDLAQKTKQEIVKGMRQGDSITAMAKRIQEVLKSSRHRAETIARTEVSTAMNEAHHMRMEQNNIEKWRFFAHIDDRTSCECKKLHKKVFPISSKKYLPPIHPNCRCVALAVIPED